MNLYKHIYIHICTYVHMYMQGARMHGSAHTASCPEHTDDMEYFARSALRHICLVSMRPHSFAHTHVRYHSHLDEAVTVRLSSSLEQPVCAACLLSVRPQTFVLRYKS